MYYVSLCNFLFKYKKRHLVYLVEQLEDLITIPSNAEDEGPESVPIFLAIFGAIL